MNSWLDAVCGNLSWHESVCCQRTQCDDAHVVNQSTDPNSNNTWAAYAEIQDLMEFRYEKGRERNALF